jgi:hypothetical protein
VHKEIVKEKVGYPKYEKDISYRSSTYIKVWLAGMAGGEVFKINDRAFGRHVRCWIR